MERQIIATKDGSHTIILPEKAISYHSRHGAIAESRHIFIESGLHHFMVHHPGLRTLRILELGFGTGLNAFLTALEAEQMLIHIAYTALETEPLTKEESDVLNYPDYLGARELFLKLHAGWNELTQPSSYMQLQKIHTSLQDYDTESRFHLIYYDAFSPGDQPELWTEAIFHKMVRLMEPGGILLTYCSKGDVRRAMKAAGLKVKKVPGPWGKRDIVRAEREIE